MKKFTIFLLLGMSFFFSLNNIFSQNISGRLVNQFGAGIPNAELKLYISPNEYNTISDLDGSFSFSDVTSVDEEILPNGYGVSNNFPNPFNPVTRIIITLPKSSNVKVRVYNVIGQLVLDRPAETLSAGTKQIDLKLDGLSNGIYLARITIDNKYTVMRKLSLVYGSQHLYQAGTSSSSFLPKSSNTNSFVNIDSLVVTGVNMAKTIFTDLPSYTGGTLELGTFTVNIEMECPGIPTVTHAGKTYNTVQIGSQCWLKENLDIGTMIESNGGGYLQTDNGVIEKYCYDNDAANCAEYGGLYEWPEAMQYVTTAGAQGICPEGWHIPTLAEFEALKDYVGDEAKKLIALGETRDATNESGFSALQAGVRNYGDGGFNSLGGNTYFWSSSESSGSFAGSMFLFYYYSNVYLVNNGKEIGFSVRCAQD